MALSTSNLQVVRRAILVVSILGAVSCVGGETERAPAVPAPTEAPSAPVVPESPSSPAPQASANAGSSIHGELREVDGQTLLRVWGTPTEMGHAHGYLLRDRILDVVDHYAFDALPGPVVDRVGPLYDAVADIPHSLRVEAAAVVEGMQAAGGAHSEVLGRELEARDLLVLNAMTDLLAIGCSSVSAWGDATAGTQQGGAPMMVRNLDWSDDPDLLENQLVIVYEPSTTGRQPVVSVAFAGYIGCLSCMNEAGVVSTFNMGYGDKAASMLDAAKGFAPANLLLRDAMEQQDVDGDGQATVDDVEAKIRGATHAGSYILHLLDDSETPARILEVEADAVVTRQPDPDGALGPNVLAATNHFREKSEPEACQRYASIERRAARSRTFGAQALWEFGRGLRLPEVVHTVLFEPRSRQLQVWLRAPGGEADGRSSGHRWAFADLLRAENAQD